MVIEEIVEGDTSARRLPHAVRPECSPVDSNECEASVREGRLTCPAESGVPQGYETGLGDYTYLERD